MRILTTFSQIVLAGFLLAQGTARAAVVLNFDDGSGTPDAVIIRAGESFSFNVYLTSTAEHTVGLSYFLVESTVGDPANPGSGMLTISGRNVAGTPYSELQTSNATFLSLANAILDPQNNNDAGGIDPDLAGHPAGTYFVASFTIQSSALIAAGTYELHFANAIYVDEAFEAGSFDGLGTYSVSVVPEPGSILLMSIGCLCIFGRRETRRAR